MIPRDYQLELSKVGFNILKENAIVYYSWEERTGKSLTAVLAAELCLVKNVLIITKKNAKKDWIKLLKAFEHQHIYTVSTYGQLKNLNGYYDLIILDEAHNYIASFPKTSKTWDQVYRFTKNKPIIYLSATPHAQGYQMLFHQFKLSSWSPWRRYASFYNWFKDYGKPYTIELYGKDVNKYDKALDSKIANESAHLFISRTRAELGFTHEPEDEVHYVELTKETKARYNELLKDKVLTFTGKYMIVADTIAKLRSSLHMLEGGSTKITMQHSIKGCLKVVKEKLEDLYLYHNYVNLNNTEKIDYIKATWGDTEDVCIMYNYIAEGIILREHFQHAEVLQATSYAEGVDLHHIEHLIIYSQDFSTARHTQRRARQASKDREWPITVHFLLVKGGISEQVYKTVSVNKKNYVDSCFTKERLV